MARFGSRCLGRESGTKPYIVSLGRIRGTARKGNRRRPAVATYNSQLRHLCFRLKFHVVVRTVSELTLTRCIHTCTDTCIRTRYQSGRDSRLLHSKRTSHKADIQSRKQTGWTWKRVLCRADITKRFPKSVVFLVPFGSPANWQFGTSGSRVADRDAGAAADEPHLSAATPVCVWSSRFDLRAGRRSGSHPLFPLFPGGAHHSRCRRWSASPQRRRHVKPPLSSSPPFWSLASGPPRSPTRRRWHTRGTQLSLLWPI